MKTNKYNMRARNPFLVSFVVSKEKLLATSRILEKNSEGGAKEGQNGSHDKPEF